MPPRICLQCLERSTHSYGDSLDLALYFLSYNCEKVETATQYCEPFLLDKFPVDHTSALSISHLVLVSEHKTILIFL